MPNHGPEPHHPPRSRNALLTPEDRQRCVCISQALAAARDAAVAGTTTAAAALQQQVADAIAAGGGRVDYVEVGRQGAWEACGTGEASGLTEGPWVALAVVHGWVSRPCLHMSVHPPRADLPVAPCKQVVDARTLQPVEDVKGREALIAVVRQGGGWGARGRSLQPCNQAVRVCAPVDAHCASHGV